MVEPSLTFVAFGSIVHYRPKITIVRDENTGNMAAEACTEPEFFLNILLSSLIPKANSKKEVKAVCFAIITIL